MNSLRKIFRSVGIFLFVLYSWTGNNRLRILPLGMVWILDYIAVVMMLEITTTILIPPTLHVIMLCVIFSVSGGFPLILNFVLEKSTAALYMIPHAIGGK